MKEQRALMMLELQEAEKMNNPFYATLKAQKEEREAFLREHENETALALVAYPEEEHSPSVHYDQPADDTANELFKHTCVEIDED